MKQYTVAIDKQTGIIDLLQNNQNCICPFQTKLLVPGQLAGQLAIQQSGCSSQCLFFNYDEAAKKVFVKCTGASFDVTEKEEQKLHLFKPLNGMA